MKNFLLAVALVLVGAVGLHAQANSSYELGERDAQQFAYGYGPMPGAHIAVGNSATGTQTVMVCPAFRATQDGRVIQLFSGGPATPVNFDTGTTSAETVTPTSVSLVQPPSGLEADQQCAQITGSFSFTHFASQNVYQVRSGTFGLQEAINDAGRNGGAVTLGQNWGGTNLMITAATVLPNVWIKDKRQAADVNWTAIGGATGIATPSTLTNATAGFGVNGANFTGGFYTGSNTYIACVAYVDIMGQEGPCSATFTIATNGSATTDQIGFTGPAASTGAVGYTIYITLNGGAYVSAYKVPLVTQPTAVGAYPASNGVCTLTTIETITPACAVTNTSYGQTGSGAVVSALTVNTSPIDPQVTTVSSTTIYTPNAGGRTTYVYAPTSKVGNNCAPSTYLPFVISAAEASTVPSVIGTVNVAPGCMNQVGRTLEICGKATGVSTATIVSIQFQWDAIGQNTAGKGVQIGNLGITPATAFATTKVETFCEDFQTTVASASATGGSINTIGGFLATSGVATAAAGQGAGTDPTTGAVGSLNLAEDARINVVSVHTTGTDGTALTLQSLTARVF